MKSTILSLLAIVAISMLSFQKAEAHCEVPCGIYEDSLRIALIKEHISTIEKSMIKIDELSKAESINYNQLIRWVNNKEEHAKKIQDIVSQYFLHQRIKIIIPGNPFYEKYQEHLTLLHQVLVYSMKAKQTIDYSYIEKLRTTVATFEEKYFHKHDE